jgi:endo-1,4-beta-xylanase
MNKTRITTAVLGAATLAAGALMLGAPTASANPQANQEFYTGNGNLYLGQPAEYWLGTTLGHIWTPQAPGKCINMDISGEAIQGNIFTLILWDCNGDTNEQWNQTDNGDGSWSYSAYQDHTGLSGPEYMDAHFGGNGTIVNGNGWNGSPAQRWTIGPASQLQSVGSPGECLDDTNWGTQNSNPMQLWQCAY